MLGKGEREVEERDAYRVAVKVHADVGADVVGDDVRLEAVLGERGITEPGQVGGDEDGLRPRKAVVVGTVDIQRAGRAPVEQEQRAAVRAAQELEPGLVTLGRGELDRARALRPAVEHARAEGAAGVTRDGHDDADGARGDRHGVARGHVERLGLRGRRGEGD